jgi:hypothetical protein
VLTVVREGWLVPPSWAYHSGLLAQTIEALWHVEHTTWFDRHEDETCSVELWRPRLPQSNAHIHRELEWLHRQVGNRYGWWKIGLILGQRLLRIPFKKLMFIEERPICSVLSAIGKKLGGISFDRDPMDCTPDNMHDFVKASDDWEMVQRYDLNGGVE